MPGRPLPARDLQNVLALARAAFEELRGARIFVTGGTGFFGHWLLESLLHADAELGLGVRATVLTRDPARFRERSPHVANSGALTLVAGDVRSFEFPAEPHSYIVHAAADSAVPAGASAAALPESIVEGTRRVLQFAGATAARRLLYVSSGAVYGRGISGIARIPETYGGAADPVREATGYDEAKRIAEQLVVAQGTQLEPVIARCFAFVGPHLPLDAHFAIGNFIRDAIAGKTIQIQGDGTPLRSYLYMSDLAVWLWTMLVRGAAGRAYNVGSAEGVSIRELAERVAGVVRPGLPVRVAREAGAGAQPATYVPDISRARAELGLGVTVGLEEAIRRTAEWYSGGK